MATTTNFGWTTPNDTDLVKDGAAAIRTLGQSIDTSLVDLKGGTTGQVLAKASNTDMDFVWSADAAGMTNPMTTTGDTIYSSSGSTPARLGIGSTGQVLTVAGGVPTWAASSAPTFTNGVTDVATNENTTSGSYTDLTTVQSVTVTTGTRAIVFISTAIQNGATANAGGIMSFGISGATTRAAADITSIGLRYFANASNLQLQFSGAFLVTGLTAGSNVFTAKFKAEGGIAAYFLNRRIQVLDLGS